MLDSAFICTDHDWQPLPSWSGRYKCARRWCGVIGYRGLVTADTDPGSHLDGPQTAWQAKPKHCNTIIPYRCKQAMGVTTCGLPVVQFKSEVDARRTRKPRCMEHRR